MAVLTGNWNKVTRIINKLDTVKFKKYVVKALVMVLIFYKAKIRKNIKTGGSLAGKPFLPNSEITKKIKGSSAPLIDKGDLMGGINYVIKEMLGFVGLKRGDIHDNSGKPLMDIGEVNEYGAVITTSGGKSIIIPARPFIGPVLKNRQILNEGKKLFAKTLYRLIFK